MARLASWRKPRGNSGVNTWKLRDSPTRPREGVLPRNSSSSSSPDAPNALAEELVARNRRGERPALSEYTERYLEHAAEITELFPALVKIEQPSWPPGKVTGPFAGTPDPAGASAPERLGG